MQKDCRGTKWCWWATGNSQPAREPTHLDRTTAKQRHQGNANCSHFNCRLQFNSRGHPPTHPSTHTPIHPTPSSCSEPEITALAPLSWSRVRQVVASSKQTGLTRSLCLPYILQIEQSLSWEARVGWASSSWSWVKGYLYTLGCLGDLLLQRKTLTPRLPMG